MYWNAMGQSRTVSTLPQFALTMPTPYQTSSARTASARTWTAASARRLGMPWSMSMNSVIVMWAPRRAAAAPPRKDAQTIMNSQNSIVQAMSW